MYLSVYLFINKPTWPGTNYKISCPKKWGGGGGGIRDFQNGGIITEGVNRAFTCLTKFSKIPDKKHLVVSDESLHSELLS